MKNRTTWYLIIEMNNGELRWVDEYTSSGTASRKYKEYVNNLSSTDRSQYPETVILDPAIKTIKLISVENRGKE